MDYCKCISNSSTWKNVVWRQLSKSFTLQSDAGLAGYFMFIKRQAVSSGRKLSSEFFL